MRPLTPDCKVCYYAVFRHKIPITKYEIMLHAMSQNLSALFTVIFSVMPLLHNACISIR